MNIKFVGILTEVLCFTSITFAALLYASEAMETCLNPSCRHPSARTVIYEVKKTTYDHPVLVNDKVETCHTVSYHTTRANLCESCREVFYIFPVETSTQHSIPHPL